MNVLDEVRALEGKRFDAMQAGELDAIAALLDPRLIYVHSSGLVDSRDTYLAALARAEYTYHSVEVVKDEQAVVEGDVVILNRLLAVSMTVKSSGQTLSRQLSATSVWSRANDAGAWLLVASHSTNLA
ncbi:nuclear transport factor 2 family protein [Burkholderia sp. Ap-962]|uniref:nuclear transport factor 2 family protein n=1 Tax=Burkholderia sp. Ap-962 TaxID=2608333 RepID=UPI0014221E5F|nr:nuclear transport factor 2 family protein [Burkholderia sp. Ap-962]NIF71311.1 nuclear transport factor 2 family protein [Burkholderia sp. Ap-962]